MLNVNGVFNRDIQPSERLLREFPQLEPILDNPAISHAFAFHERQAIHGKRVHVFLGRTGLLCLLISMAFFDYELTLGRLPNLGQLYGVTKIAAVVAALLAGIGVVCQLFMIFGKTKERWLIERFAAERLRCLKFQAFTLVAQSETAAELATKVAAFTKEAMAQLDQELMGGRAALIGFSPTQSSLPIRAIVPHPNDQLLRDAYKAYVSTRWEVQVQHFDSESALSEKRSRRWMSLSEVAFALGAILALVQFVWAVVNGSGTFGGRPNAPELSLSCFVLLLFIASAVLAVYQRGAAHSPDAERYKHYARELRWLKAKSELKSAEEFLRFVDQTEDIERRELFEFCRDTAHSSYIF